MHEPKGVATASANYTYFANGSGSGSWKKVGSETLKGISGDGGASNLRILTTGDNGFKLVIDSAYADMQIANNAVQFPVTAAADPTLNTTSQYVLLTGPGAPFSSTASHNITFSTDRLTVNAAGVYKLTFWANLSLFPSNTAKVAVKFRLNGTTFAVRKVVTKSTANGDYGVMAASAIVTLAANDYVQLFVASDTTGNLNIENANLILDMIKAT